MSTSGASRHYVFLQYTCVRSFYVHPFTLGFVSLCYHVFSFSVGAKLGLSPSSINDSVLLVVILVGLIDSSRRLFFKMLAAVLILNIDDCLRRCLKVPSFSASGTIVVGLNETDLDRDCPGESCVDFILAESLLPPFSICCAGVDFGECRSSISMTVSRRSAVSGSAFRDNS